MYRKLLVLGIAMMTGLSFLPALALGGNVNTDTSTVTDKLKIHARPPLEIPSYQLAEQYDLSTKSPMYNYSGTSIDVYTNYSFVFTVRDHDDTEPNSTYINRICIIGFVNFEGDPGNDTMNTTAYDKRNYEFQIYAERTGGGGREATQWVVNSSYPRNVSQGDKEIEVLSERSVLVDESDFYLSDGINDSVTFRLGFRLGNQTRNTNSTGNLTDDDWKFFVLALDTYGVRSDTRSWMQKFDVYQFADINAAGRVGGGGAPGGSGFKLMRGADTAHRARWAANNNASFSVNATDFNANWLSDTLLFSGQNVPMNDTSNWTQIGVGYVDLGHSQHAYNGTLSQLNPQAGENGDGFMYWMCSGIPAGTSSGSYESTVSFKITIDGT